MCSSEKKEREREKKKKTPKNRSMGCSERGLGCATTWVALRPGLRCDLGLARPGSRYDLGLAQPGLAQSGSA